MQFSKKLQREAERKHYSMSKDVFISEIRNRKDATFIYDEKILDFFWNYAGLIETEKPLDLIRNIEDFYSSREREPAAYITPNTKPENLESILKDEGFEVKATDAWMFYSGGDIDELNLRAEIVTGENQISRFLELFSVVYGSGDDETYGELPDYYIEALKRSFENIVDPESIRDFVFYQDGEPIGIGTVNFEEGFAGIYNVGVIPDQRGKGIGGKIVSFLVNQALGEGVDHIFLQTEKGSKNEKFFMKNGFETGFVGTILVKTDG